GAETAYTSTKNALVQAGNWIQNTGWPDVKSAAQNAFKAARDFCSSKISQLSDKVAELHDKSVEKIDKYLDDYLADDGGGLLLSSPKSSSSVTNILSDDAYTSPGTSRDNVSEKDNDKGNTIERRLG
uniref:hypothetical protein n=1 Tax=Legionella longbeachae TaxID=450 RepID=UPI00399D13E4